MTTAGSAGAALHGAAPLAEPLHKGVSELGLDLSDGQLRQLLDYLALLQKWNRVYNLTAIRDPNEMLRQHLLDSLAIVAPLKKVLQARARQAHFRMLDVGSGAGLPGVVVAICCPQVAVTCVDAVAKKMAFVRQAALDLGLANLSARHARVETLTERFDVVCSRAFASLVDFVRLTSDRLQPGGCWLAMKGQHPAQEIADLPAAVWVFHVEQLQVPGLDAQRCIVWMEPAAIGD